MAKKPNKKANKVDSQPQQLPPINTCGSRMEPITRITEDSFAVKLTHKAESQLHTIDGQRERISYLQKELIDAKETLSTALLNHAMTQRDLEKALDVPNIAH